MKPPPHLHLHNLSEDVWPFIQSLDPVSKSNEIAENRRLAGHEYLGLRAQFAGTPLHFICPSPIHPEFTQYLDRLFPGTATLHHPTRHTGQLSSDILRDSSCTTLLQTIPTLSAYCPSPQLYQLLKHPKPSPIPVDLPTASSWKQVAKFGTKTGLRRLIRRLHDPLIYMAPGRIFSTYPPALAFASHFPSVVFKTQKGHAGMGVAIFRPDQLPPTISAKKSYLDHALGQSDRYWYRFPLVVEDFIPTDSTIGGGVPNIEGYVDPSGQVNLRYCCGLRVLPNGTFAGTETGPEVLPPTTIDRLTYLATTIGGIYARHGYRGVFELDTLAGQDGRLYIAESNIRRNGGTHSYHVARNFFGPDYPLHHHVITHIIKLQPPFPSFSQILNRAKNLIFQPGHETGIIPTDPDLLAQGNFGYMVLAETKVQATSLEHQLLRLLQT